MDLTLVYLLLFALLLLLSGYFVPFASKRTARIVAWVMAVVTVFFSTIITSQEPPLYRMIAIVTLQLLSMKMVVVAETYSGGNKLSFIQWCAFSLGWFGMRPALFEKLPSGSLPYFRLVIKGISRIIIGLLLIYLSVLAETLPIWFLQELLLLVGLNLILHFGILNLAAAAWRLMGVDVRELFRAPYKAKSLKEFWGKRWNIAFSEMTALIAYRPLKNKVTPATAVTLSFLLSGALHEIAISFPVSAGYGLPFLYFSIHGLLMYAEEKLPGVKRIIDNRILSHIWVLFWLLLPMPLLFHTKFIELVLKPLRNIILSLI